MGFFKSILTNVVGEDALDNINSLMPGNKKETTSNNPLATPPPPAVPERQESMSVMIAVNGQSYGPYERATLLEMIDNGALTRDTLVFMDGMSEWKAAKDVDKVAKLFGAGKAPAAPPVPWAAAPVAEPAAAPVSTPATSYDNSLSPRLNQLITSAVADGEISDLERQVLIRNAQQEGVAMDEFVMVLEARLFEQRQMLKAQQEEKERRDKAAQAQVAAAAAASKAAAAPARPKLSKCPHCGAPYRQLATRCPECGNDYPAVQTDATGGKTAWEKLADKLSEIDHDSKISDDSRIMNAMFGSTGTKSFVKAKTITNFPIPVSKTDLFEFFTNCAPMAKKKTMWNLGGKMPGEVEIANAYYNKCTQVILKARIVMKDDKEMLSQIEQIAKQYKIEA